VTGALSLVPGGPSPLWFATRATGVVALLLLTGTVLLGIASLARPSTRQPSTRLPSTRLPSTRLPRVVLAGLHRNLSLLVLVFVALHVAATVADGYAPVGLAAAVIPFTSPYRTVWLGLGAVAFDLLLAVTLTSLLRDRLPYRAWRLVHWLAYACWPVALWHGLGTGTDSRLPWLLALDALCVAAVAAAVGWRLSLAAPGLTRVTAATATVALIVATAVFTLTGPLQPGWARRAGTPPQLLGTAGTARQASHLGHQTEPGHHR
jgi:sulfoxide reductase heme-binding subunit YedZ